MAFDAGMIACLISEFNARLTDGKLEKIHQPEKDQIDLIFRAKGEILRLALSAAPGAPRMGITSLPKENPPTPPFFCTLLRKHLASGILRAVKQEGFERMAVFYFDAKDEMGFGTKRLLICELMGKYSNLILCDGEYKILGVLRPVDFTKSEKRQLLPGMRYELPPKQEGKCDPLTETREEFLLKAAAAGERGADKFILNSYCGISPLIARELAFEAAGRYDCPTLENAPALWQSLARFAENVKTERFAPCIVRIEGKNAEYSFLPIKHYEGAAEILPFDSPSAMLDCYFEEKERSERVHQRAQDLFKLLTNGVSRLQRKMEAQSAELAQCAEKERYKELGDLITANLYALKKGQQKASLINYYADPPETIEIELDSRLTPAANAQKYFKRYNKAKTAERELTVQIEKAKEELAYLYSAIDALERAVLPYEIEEIRSELVRTGYLSKSKIPQSKKSPPARYLEYETSGGFRVLCGRNNLQNDALTFKVADKNDWWFHVHGAPGTHVILLCDGVDDPPAEDFTQAATIAAVNSSLCAGAQVTVDYTRVRYVKKPPAAHPGFAIYHTNYSAEVTPDEGLCKRLLKS